MKKPHIPKIRELLRANHNGLTAKQICAAIDEISKPKVARSALTKMPDVYVDRWILEPESRGQYQAVYMAVIPPMDCPHPKDRFPEVCRTRWIDRGAQA
jgi:hypothetical protein